MRPLNEIIEKINEEGLYEQWKTEAKVQAKKLGIEFVAPTDVIVETKAPGVFDVFVENYDIFLNGLLETLKLAAITVFFGTIFGALIAIIKLSKNPLLRFLTAVYVEVLRGTPILVQLYILPLLFADGLPMAEPVQICLRRHRAGLQQLGLCRGNYPFRHSGGRQRPERSGQESGYVQPAHDDEDHSAAGGQEYPAGAGQRVCHDDQGNLAGFHLLYRRADVYADAVNEHEVLCLAAADHHCRDLLRRDLCLIEGHSIYGKEDERQ